MVPESHPLQQLFQELVSRNYCSNCVGLRDSELCGYVANMLCEFCDAEQLFRLRNAQGHQLSDVGEMLLESDPVYGPAPNFDRERQVRKHIGDYTLFFTGLFPESINHFRLRKQRRGLQHAATPHHAPDALQRANVLRRIAVDDEHIGVFAGCDAAHVLL